MKLPEVSVNTFTIVEHMKDAVYYIYFQRPGGQILSLGWIGSKIQAVYRVTRAVKQGGIESYTTVYM